jgi:hypothetical protein
MYYGGVFAAQHAWGWSFVRLSKITWIALYVLDGVFFTTLLYYFNRPSVKKYFDESPQNTP